MIKRVIAFAAALIVLIAALWLSQRDEPALKVSGFVEADEIRVGSRVGGRVKSVHVDEGQQVKRGDLLVELEPFDLLERQSELRSSLAQSQANLDRLRTGFRPEQVAQAKARVDQFAAHLTKLTNGPRKEEIDAATAELELAESELELATIRHQRAETLVGRLAVSREEYDEATTQLRVARSRHQVKESALKLLTEGTRPEDIAEARAQLEEAREAWKLMKNGYRAEDIAEATAAVNASKAAEKVIERQLDELRITAPGNGMIEAVELQPGDLVGINTPVISIMDTSRLWIRAYVPENRLNLKIGEMVPIGVDSFPGEKFTGRITFVARQAEFTPGNVQTPEERSKQVFRIKVDLVEGLDRLRPGMSADVWLDRRPADE